MLAVMRGVRLGLITISLLFICGQIGNHNLMLCHFLSSPAACPGKVICWGGVIGSLTGSLLLMLYIFRTKSAERRYLIPVVTAMILANAFYVSRMIQVFCS